MKRKKVIVVSAVGITIVLLTLLGLTYAYFLTRIQGNTNEKSISVTTANLELTYADGNGTITSNNIMPGTTLTDKEFTVTNNGNATVNNYAVYLEELVNELTRPDDMVYTLTCTSSKENKTCKGVSETTFPKLAGIIVTNSIDVGETQTYKLTVTYKEMNVDQSDDMNKKVSARVQIYNLQDIVDVTGTVTNANEGDYVELHSNPRKSMITTDNKYLIAAVEPGTHTLYVKDKEGTVKESKEITIKKGSTASIDANVITITSNIKNITIDLDVSNNSIEIGGITYYDDESFLAPYSLGTIVDMFSVAQTYRNNMANLTFASAKTAFDTTTTNELDCSSFLSLVLGGITYNDSRYNSNNTNIKSFDYGITLPTNKYREGRYLANDLAHYADENGYSYKLNNDVSNVKPGDIIFFSTFESNYYKGITHASFVVDRLPGDRLLVYHANNTTNNLVGFQVINLFSDITDAGSNNGYSNGAVMAARFPIISNNNVAKTNLITNGEEQVLNYNGATTTKIKEYNLSSNLEPNTPYTLYLNGKFGTEEYPDVYPAIFANTFGNSNYLTQVKYTWVDDDKYVMHFITNDSITVSKIAVYMLSKTNVANSNRTGSIYGAKLYKGFISKNELISE